MENIFEEIRKEREYQTSRWGTEADDQLNTPADWVLYINNYASKWMDGTFRPYKRATLLKFRESMVKSATLAVAAIESIDKQLNGTVTRADVLKEDDQ